MGYKNTSNKFLLLFVIGALLSFGYFLYKFANIVKPVGSYFEVQVDPQICFICKGCPCEYTFPDGDTYTLTNLDQHKCNTAGNIFSYDFETNTKNTSIFLRIPDYVNFSNCVKWHAKHPSNLSDNIY